MKTIFIKKTQSEKKWYLIDAEGKVLGRVAVEAAKILRGKNKAYFTPHQDMGDVGLGRYAHVASEAAREHVLAHALACGQGRDRRGRVTA